MKKKNLKSLMLNKSSISNLTGINGGKVGLSPSLIGICPVESNVFTCDPDVCDRSDTCISFIEANCPLL